VTIIHHQPAPLTRPLPWNIEAEEAVIGSLMIDHSGIARVLYLTPQSFYRPRHQSLMGAMLELYRRGEPADPVTLTDELERTGHLADAGGPAGVTEMFMRVPTAIHLEYYARIVERDACLRRLAAAAERIMALAYESETDLDDLLSRAEGELFSVTQSRRIATRPQTLGQLASAAQDRYDAIYQGIAVPGIPTASADLNHLLTGGGYQRKKLYVLAARPKMGKTSRLIWDMTQQAEAGKVVLFFSLEMDADAVFDRSASARAGVNLQRVMGGPLQDGEYKAIGTYAARAAGGEFGTVIVCDNRGMSPPEMEGVLRWAISEHGAVDIVYIDHLQEVGEAGLSAAKRRTSNYADIVGEKIRYVRNMAGKYDVPMVMAAQLNREVEKRQDKRPLLSDLKDSGGVEETADAVMFLYRDDYYNPKTERPGVAEVIMAAQRNGPTGTIDQHFATDTGKWGDLAPAYIEQANPRW
jgi:replicative DNA helicase